MGSKLSYNKKKMKNTAIVLFVLLMLMTVNQLYVKNKRYEIPKSLPTEQNEATEIPYSTREEKKLEEIVVHIVGEVNNPCVVKMSKGSRLYEAVEKAGGFTEQADAKGINLAQVLVDGSQYVIPKIGEELIIHKNDGTQASGQASENDGKVNINSANKEELQKLSGIGEVLAERIIKHREKNGAFKNIFQLLDVEGIGEAKFNSIKEDIYCNG